MRPILALGLIATLGVPFAAADPLACSDVTEREDSPTGIYVLLDPPRPAEAWAESNGVPGLQRQPCEFAPGDVRGADTQLVEVT